MAHTPNVIRPKERLLRKRIPKEAIRKELEKWSDRLGHWNELFTAVVVLGLVTEYLPDVTYFLPSIIAGFVTAHHEQLHQCGGLLVVIGVAGELWIDSRESKVETDLREESNSVIAELHGRAAEANERAALAQQRTAELQKEITVIREPRVARLGIKKFSESLKEKPKGTAEVMYQPDDGEAMEFAFAINSGMVLGGWRLPVAVRPIPADAVMGGKSAPIHFISTLPPSIRVGGHPTGVSAIANTTIPGNQPLVDLREAFLSCDFIIGLGLDPDLPDGLIRVVVAPKS